MESLTELSAQNLLGVSLISWVVSVVALADIVPLWITGIKMNHTRELRWQRIGATIMMGPLLWFLLEPVWQLFHANWEETASIPVLVVLLAFAIDRDLTLTGRLNTIAYIKQKSKEARDEHVMGS